MAQIQSHFAQVVIPLPGPPIDFELTKKAATAIVYQSLVAGVLNTIAIQGDSAAVIANQATALGTDQLIINAAIVYVNALGGGTLFIDESTYTLGAAVDLLDTVYLYGSGTATILTIPAALDTCIDTNNADNFKIAYLTARTTGAGANDAILVNTSNGGDIFGCTIDDSGQDGISVDANSTDIKIHDNDITVCVRYGVYNLSDENIITDNRISVCQDGIHLEDADLGLITDNIITDCTRDGIRLVGDSDENTIMDNASNNNTGYGINITVDTCNENWVKNNQLRGNTTASIQDLGTDTKLATHPISLIQGTVFISAPGSAWGWEINADTEFALGADWLPLELQQIVRIRIIAVGLAAPGVGNEMRAQFTGEAATFGEVFTTHSIDVVDLDSEETNFAIDDVIHWVLDATNDADIANIVGGDRLQLKVLHEGAGGGSIETDAVFSSIAVEYV